MGAVSLMRTALHMAERSLYQRCVRQRGTATRSRRPSGVPCKSSCRRDDAPARSDCVTMHELRRISGAISICRNLSIARSRPSEWQVAVLRAVIGIAADLLFVDVAKFRHCSLVRPQALGGDRLRRSVTLQGLLHETQRRSLVAGLRHVAFQHFPLMIDCTPKVGHLAIDPDVHLVEVPVPVPKTTHPAHALPPDVGREQRSEPVPPEPHCLMAKVDTALETEGPPHSAAIAEIART